MLLRLYCLLMGHKISPLFVMTEATIEGRRERYYAFCLRCNQHFVCGEKDEKDAKKAKKAVSPLSTGVR